MHLSRSNTIRVLTVFVIVALVNPLWNAVVAAEPDDTSPLDNWRYFRDYDPVLDTDTIFFDKLLVHDADNDGRVEIISGGSNGAFFHVGEYVAGLDTYQTEGMRWEGGLYCLEAGDVDGDGISEIFAGTTQDDELRVISGADLTQLTEVYAVHTGHHIRVMRLAHPTTAPDDLWLYTGDTAQTTVVDTETFSEIGEFFHGAGEFEVGDVQGDEWKEIVYSSGEVYSFDGMTGTSLYAYPWDEFDPVELVNVDGDPYLEIITGTFSGTVRAYDYGDPTPLWEMPTMAYPIHVGDVTGDGQIELVVFGLDSSINFVDPMTHTVFWTYPLSVASNVAFGDTDGDGEMEMVINGTKVVDVATQTVEWSAEHLIYGPFQEVAIGNLDGAGGLETVFASKTGVGGDAIAGGWLMVRSAASDLSLLKTQVFLDNGHRLTKIHDVEIGDVDNDGDQEIAVLGSDFASDTANIVVFDGQTLSKEAELEVSDCRDWQALKIANVDADPVAEFVATGCAGGASRVFVIDTTTGGIDWQSDPLAGTGEDVVVANVDDDPALEIIALDNSAITTPSDYIRVYDSITHDLWTSDAGNYTALATYDMEQNGGPEEILIGTTISGVITLEAAFPGPGHVERSRFYLYGPPVTGISGYQITGGDVRLAVVNYNRIIGIDPLDPVYPWAWQSHNLGTPSSAEHSDGLATAPIPTETGTMFLVGGIFTVNQFGGVVEQPRPAMASRTYTVNEDDGIVTVTAQRLGSPDGLVSVEYATDDRTAIDGSDYTGVSGFFIWADGDVNDKSVDIGLLDDSAPEPDEDFVFNLFNVIGGVLGNPSRATVTIVDDDSSTVAFTAATAEVDETEGIVTLNVSRTDDLGFAASVDWATADGSAVAGEDYTSASGTLNWAAANGDTKTIDITILDDALYEDDEAFIVTLSNPGGNAVLGEPVAAEVTIDSEDVIEIVFSASGPSIGEGDGNATITAWRTGAANGLVTVDHATADDTATAGQDYTATTGTLTWVDGDTDPKTYQVPINDDAVVELDETVLLSLENPTGGATVGAPGSATLTIEDNDGTLLRFTAASFSIAEAGGSAEISVERFGADTSGAVGVDFATADGTAVAGQDYQSTTGSLSWADGEITDKTFSVIIFDDGLLEASESLLLDLSNPTGTGAVGNPASADLFILDDEWTATQINTETSGPQTRPDIAEDPAGRAVAVWDSYLQDGSGWGVFGQRFDPQGDPAGVEFRVNEITAGDQRNAAVAKGPDGSFMVVWRGSDASGDGIRGRRFNASGAPLGGEFAINAGTAGDQDQPDIAIDGLGVALVAWQSDSSGDLDLRGQVFDSGGSPVGSEIAVNSTTDHDQQLPAVAASTNGGFVVAWQSRGQDGPAEGIVARRFGGGGSPLTGEQVVNQWTSGDQILPDVCQTSSGAFLVVWEDTTHQDGSGSSIRGRWFDNGASPMGGDVQINTYSTDDQMRPTVASNSTGNTMVAWESMGQDGSDLGVYSQALSHEGLLVGPEFQINSYATGIQYRPVVTASDAGTFWVVWASGGQDGSADGVYGLFAELPGAAEIFTDGFESGDTSAWSSTLP